MDEYNEEDASPDIYSYHDLMLVNPISLSDDICRLFRHWEPFLEWEVTNQLLSEPATIIALCPEHVITLREFNESIEYEDDALIPDDPETWQELMILAKNSRYGWKD